MGESRALRWVRRVGLGALTLIVAVPLVAVARTSLEPLAEVGGAFRWLPRHVTLAAYRDMWRTVPLGRYLLNSFVVSVSAAALAVLVAVPAAHALARSRSPGVRAFGLGALATQAAPGLLFLLPLFLLYAKIRDVTGVGLTGSYAGLILADLAFAVPFAMWMLAAHFAELPRAVEEAAQLDGAGRLAVLVRIVLPSSAPAVGAVAAFAFVASWSEVLFASVLTGRQTQTVAVGLHAYATESTVHWNQLMAAALATSAPIAIAFLALRGVLVRLVAGSAGD